MPTKKKTTVIPTDATPAYKGFLPDMTCRGFQYEADKTYNTDSAELCEVGFHACEYPLDVFGYYPPATSVYREVDLHGDVKKGDDKTCATGITIKAALDLPGFIKAAVEFTFNRAKSTDLVRTDEDQSAASATGDQSAASATGYQSAASATGDRSAASATGYRSAASATGDQSAASATGYRSAASATGDQSAASATGDQSAASATGYRSAASATGYRSAASATGYRSAASATGYRSAASATGDQSAASATGCRSAASATGDQSAASATGDQSAASATGDRSAASATGDQSVAAAFGLHSKAMSNENGMVIVTWWDAEAERKRVTVAYVGENGIKAHTWYRCDDAGLLVEVAS